MDNIPDNRLSCSKHAKSFPIPARVLKQMRQLPFTNKFTVTELGYRAEHSQESNHPKKRHQRHLLIFVPEGSFALQINARKHVLKPKQAILIPAGTSYSYGETSDKPWLEYWMLFEGSGAESLLEWTPFSESNPVQDCTASENVKRHFNAIINAIKRGYTEHTALQLSLALIKILISLHENPLEKTGTASLSKIETVMNRMREDVSNPQTLKRYAQMAGYSVTQFSHLFGQHTGTSPINYLNELRIQQAADRLKNTKDSIKSISQELGFSDPLYFSRSFKKCVGISPKAYRHK